MRAPVQKRWVWIATSTFTVGLMALVAAGCASILHGPMQPMAITSTPTGANVSVDGAGMGSTPITTSLSRKQEHIVKVEMQGYQPMEIHLNKRIDGWFWGNLLFGGIVGMIIDGTTGAMYKLTPAQIEAVLKQEGVGSRLHGDQLLIGVSLAPDPAWEKISQLKPDTMP